MPFHVWFAFACASFVLVVIPGPTVLLVLSYALSQGRRVALATVGGVALGDIIAMSASLAGLGALVMASAKLFVLLRWVGAAYLVYLGIKLLRSPPLDLADDGEASVAVSPGRVFVHAASVTALNPKSIVFFIAFVPQFIDPEAALPGQFALLVATFVGLAATNTLAYALLAARLRQALDGRCAIRTLARSGGIALVAMGLATVTLRRS
ncbi:LysE family translocator [Novosphingobium sp. 1949]|uniref:LysE family translocator n=1 Tax=Novosphingobium organovorum TaxID=2930092 RepID=A0ABT0BG44_9SPHN|nr:LysE family translocator [Novosphingobium organovorum]MCJ2184010.1 LysE family translocator [Novosphingobium organovorum]